MLNLNPIDPGYPSPTPGPSRAERAARMAIFILSAIIFGAFLGKVVL